MAHNKQQLDATVTQADIVVIGGGWCEVNPEILQRVRRVSRSE
ncbi:MAG: hypothetical protein PW845_21790 [Pseudomonas sp.]|nr:hypothetical protein [Pseudomonas sp. PIA16]MDE1167937.1 hypothetical protein [Pseudomonas sp.]